MSKRDDDSRKTADETGVPRRSYLQLAGALGGVAALSGCLGDDDDNGDGDGDDGTEQTEPSPRLETAEYAAARSFDTQSYERIHTHRKSEAIKALLRDPEVHEVVSDWIVSFEAYEVLTNQIETISIQGCPDFSVDRSGFYDDDADEAVFDVTAEDRQVVYGLIDRYTDEILALEITDPTDVEWTKEQDEEQIAVGKLIHEHPDVEAEFGDLEDYTWYPSWKGVGGGGFGGMGNFGLAHGEGNTSVQYIKDDGEVRVLSAFIDGSSPDDAELLTVRIVDNQVEHPPQTLAETIDPYDESVLGVVPDVEFEQRPYYTAPDGMHRIERPDESFEQDGWSIEYEPAEYQGFTVSAEFNDSPVFEAMNSPITYTGYYLPPREGRNTLDWYFPDHDTMFNGDLLFWDIHMRDFGGPGIMGKLDFDADNGTPSGFQLKGHYHTGAEGVESIDFHAGFRYGPYNYDISYEFYEDGVFMPLFRRAGPGFITEYIDMVTEDSEAYMEGDEYVQPVLQHYTSCQAIDVTPGTEDGVEIELFDGEEWTLPEEEFYVEGAGGMLARFNNPDGSETIEVPLDDDMELVVVTRDEDEIGPGEASAHRRVDEDDQSELYHPAQYVDGDPIQGERVIVWLLIQGATDQMPYPSGTSNFATNKEIRLLGY